MDYIKVFSLVGLIAYFAILLTVVVFEKKNENVVDYFFAGRRLPFWALSITFIASWWGAGSALSTVDLALGDGLGAFWYYGVPVLLSTFLMILGAKAIRRVGFLTQGQMVEARYSKRVGFMLSIAILAFMTLTAASQMVAIGFFLGGYFNITYEYAVLLGTVIVLVYSVVGGFRGVVLTDIIQFVLLLLAAIIVFYVALSEAGGFDNVYAIAIERGKTDYFDFFAGMEKYLVYVVTFGCSWAIQANVWQRISAARNDEDAKRMTTMSLIVYIPLYLIVVLTGMAAYALYTQVPEQGVVMAIVNEKLHPLLSAFVFVGIAAAIMSTMDSVINTAAMTLSVDLCGDYLSEQKKLSFSRVATLIVSVVGLLISLKIRSILDVAWLASDIITTGIFVPLVAGFFWRRGTAKGAFASMCAGLLYSSYNLLISFGVELPSAWEQQSALQVILGVSLSLVVYVLISLGSEPEYEKADKFISLAKGKTQDDVEGAELSPSSN